MLVLANVDSSAAAAEFAGLGVFLVYLAAIPTTIVVKLIVMRPFGEIFDHFKRGMIVPAVALAWAILYQTGLWDLVF